MKPDREALREQVRNLPQSPGVYKYYDAEGALLYIGKARNLKNRVSSYFFARADHSYRIKRMVSLIQKLEFTVVSNEYDALLLENNLIKKYQPRYNVSLRDDKTYPYLCLKKERFPRLISTRSFIRDGSEYFGPYANVSVMKVILDLMRKLFLTRSCNLNLTEENIQAGKFRVCLDYHIGLCKGPCQAYQTEAEYMDSVQNIRNVLKGNIGEVVKYLKNSIQTVSDNLEFEKAHELKEKLDALERFQTKSTIVNPSIHNVDVFSMYSNEKHAFVNYLKVINGSIITTDTIEFTKRIEEEDSDILQLAIAELRQKYNSNSQEVLVPFPLLLRQEGMSFVVPKVGDKKKLLELSRKNAFYYYQERQKVYENNKERRRNFGPLQQAKDELGLKNIPYHIECFDNSNIQGSFPVSAIVVFKNGVPSKKDYRFFNVKTVVGPDDFATMEEAVGRRYRRMLDEKTPLPQLIIIDGGKGQLSSAWKVLNELGIQDQVDIIGIAKRLEEIYKPGDPLPLSINKKSPSLRLIQRARDEAHRFGITAHRKKRNAVNVVSSIQGIKGIGEATAEKLLKHFKSVKKIKEATFEEIEKVVGKAKAKVVVEALAPKEEEGGSVLPLES